MSRAAVFGGISVMLLVSAVLAPRIGRRIDRDGARDLMVPGTLVGAVALLVIGIAQGPFTYWLGWAIFGLAVAMMLNAGMSGLAIDGAWYVTNRSCSPPTRRSVTSRSPSCTGSTV